MPIGSLTSVPEEDERSASRFSCFYIREEIKIVVGGSEI
jgi:hypothetical protein